MASSNRKPDHSKALDEEDEQWELVGDEIAPRASSQSHDAASATTAPGGAEISLASSVPIDANEDARDARKSGRSGASPATADRRSAEDGGDLVDSDEGDAFDEDQRLLGSPSTSTKKPEHVLCKEEKIKDGPEKPSTPSSLASPEIFAASAPDAEDTEKLTPVASTTQSPDSQAVTLAESSLEGASENPPTEETSARSGFLGSLSAIGKMRGETKVDERRWDSMRSFARDLERQHGVRRRAQDRAGTFRRSARELLSAAKEESQRFGAISREVLSAAKEESQRFRATFRETWDETDDLVRAKSTQAKYAASSAKDSLCRANEEHGISEKVAAAAVVGGAALLALGNPRAGLLAVAVAGSSVAAGEAMKHSSAHSISTASRDHGLREGLHLD